MTLFEMSNSSKTINIRSLLSEPNYKFSGSNEYSLDDYIHFMIRGGWPYLINKSEKQCSTLLKSYVDDISKVDIKELSPKINKTRVDSLIYSLSRNISTDVSLKTLSADSKNENSVSEKTILNYIDRLQEIFFLELLQQ
jgi:predicted AAA+ superfamily ATPase